MQFPARDALSCLAGRADDGKNILVSAALRGKDQLGMGDGELLYGIEDGVATITINRPEKRNALNGAVLKGIREGLTTAKGDPDVRVVVITGTGDKAFCSGADLEQTMPATEGGTLAAHYGRGVLADVFRDLFSLGKPVVSRINGHALAGGFGLALAGDILIAAENATFGTPEINVGLWPMMITTVMMRAMPPKIALELMMTGRRVSADEAVKLGFVNRVVPLSELDAAVGVVAGELASKSPAAMRLGRDAFYATLDMPADQALGYLHAQLALVAQTEDAAEGMTAYLQKREPKWKGR